MDATLFAASATLSMYLPQCIFQSQTTLEHSSMAVTIGLSLSIFSLSILEATPMSWLMILSPDPQQQGTIDNDGTIIVVVPTGYLTISRAYWLLLWALTLVILVALPSIMGTTIGDACGYYFQRDRDDQKYPGLACWRRFPWWCRFIIALVKLFVGNIYKLVGKIFRRQSSSDPIIIAGALGNTTTSTSTTMMMMNINEEHELRNSTSTDSLDATRSTVVGTSPRSATSSHAAPNNNNNNNKVFASIGSICGVSIVLIFVASLGPLVVHTSTDKNALSVIISWLCAVGFMVSSVLNGFGSVSMPYTCLSGLFLKPVRPEVITKLESERQSVLEALNFKKQSMREMTVSITPRGGGGVCGGKQRQRNTNGKSTPTTAILQKSGSSGGIIRTFSEIGEEVTNRRQILQTEITFLEDLYKEMGADIEELKHSQIQAAAARTTMGMFRTYVGLVFSLILLIRLVWAAFTIWQSYMMKNTNTRRVAKGDIVTTTLLWLTGQRLVSREDYAYLSQIVSLSITLFLSFSQVRTFIRAVAAVNRWILRFYQKLNCSNSRMECHEEGSISWFSNNNNNTIVEADGHLSLLIAMVTGCYFLSCIVVLKMMLPEEFCGSFATALGGMDVFTIHTAFVNTIFTFSAICSVAMLGILFGIQRKNNHRHTSSAADTVFLGPDAV